MYNGSMLNKFIRFLLLSAVKRSSLFILGSGILGFNSDHTYK